MSDAAMSGTRETPKRFWSILILALVWTVSPAGQASAEPSAQLPGNELSPSPSQPATPEGWWLRSLKDGSDIQFSKFKGKVVFLAFWATWCGPCLTEMPTIERMYQKLKGSDVAVVVVANQNPRDLTPYLSKHPFSFPMYTCGLPPKLFWWHGLPATFIVAPDGRVVRSFQTPHPFDTDEFVNDLKSLRK
jgi:thiol-disulfide isomerase/thioredoxin